MSHVVISSFENVETGDLQAQGEAITVFDSEARARAHFAQRSSALESAVSAARASDPDATFITWLVVLQMPLEVSEVDEALEDLELILEETESVDDPFGEFVLAYEGKQYAAAGTVDYAQIEALRGLEAWLT
jgi:hypothetical protein